MGSARATTLYARGPTPGVATRRASIAAAAAVSVFALSACSSLKDQAKEDFSSDFNAPTDRMEGSRSARISSRSSFQKAPVPPKGDRRQPRSPRGVEQEQRARGGEDDRGENHRGPRLRPHAVLPLLPLAVGLPSQPRKHCRSQDLKGVRRHRRRGPRRRRVGFGAGSPIPGGGPTRSYPRRQQVSSSRLSP